MYFTRSPLLVDRTFNITFINHWLTEWLSDSLTGWLTLTLSLTHSVWLSDSLCLALWLTLSGSLTYSLLRVLYWWRYAHFTCPGFKIYPKPRWSRIRMCVAVVVVVVVGCIIINNKAQCVDNADKILPCTIFMLISLTHWSLLPTNQQRLCFPLIWPHSQYLYWCGHARVSRGTWKHAEHQHTLPSWYVSVLS